MTLALFVALLGCATPLRLPAVGEKGGPLPATVLAFDYHLEMDESVIQDEGCQLILLSLDQHREISVPLAYGKRKVAVEAPAGTLQLRKIYCYAKAYWEIFDWGLNLQVEPGKINYGGMVQLVEDSNRTLHLHILPVAKDADRKFAPSLSEADRQRLVPAVVKKTVN